MNTTIERLRLPLNAKHLILLTTAFLGKIAGAWRAIFNQPGKGTGTSGALGGDDG